MNTELSKCLDLNRLKLVLCLIAGYTNLLFSQDEGLLFDHLTVENGLSQNTVTGIIKDKYGFMWFGTWSGLCRYDGYKFKVYKPEANNQHSISQNRIHLVIKDEDGNIWALPYDTTVFCRYNYETDDFTRFPRNQVKQAIVDSLSRTRSISRINATQDGFTWHVNSNDFVLTQTNNRTHHQISYVADPLNRWALNDGDVTDIYLDDSHILWVGTYSGGVNKANITANPFSYVCKTLDGNQGLIDNNIRSIYQDHHGNIWIGTRSKGITKIDRQRHQFENFIHNQSNVNSLISDQIRKIYIDYLGFVWIGTKNGLDRYDPVKNHFYHYSAKSGNRIPSNWVYVIMEDSHHELWIGTWNGIARYNRKKDFFQDYDSKLLGFTKPAIRTFLEDNHGYFWISAEGQGLVQIKRVPGSDPKDSLQMIHHYQYIQAYILHHSFYTVFLRYNAHS